MDISLYLWHNLKLIRIVPTSAVSVPWNSQCRKLHTIKNLKSYHLNGNHSEANMTKMKRKRGYKITFYISWIKSKKVNTSSHTLLC